MNLPIILPSSPHDRTLWQQVERRLEAIAINEQSLNRRDRLVNNSLALAKNYAKNNEWKSLWEFLRDRKIVALPTHHGILLKLWTLQAIAQCLQCAKEAKPIAIPAIKRKRYRKIKNPRFLLEYLTIFAAWASTVECSQLYIRLLRCNPKLNKEVGISTKVIGIQLDEIFDKCLTDKWQDVHSIQQKLAKLTDNVRDRSALDARLKYRAITGDIYKLHPEGSVCVFYSKVEATEFESEWLDVGRAYLLAQSRGCTSGFNTFRTKATRTDYTKQGVINYYAQFGLEFRFKAPSTENRFFKWRDAHGRS